MSRGKPTPPPYIYASRLQEPPSQGELDGFCRKYPYRDDDVRYWHKSMVDLMDDALLEITCLSDRDMTSRDIARRARQIAREALSKFNSQAFSDAMPEGWE